MTLIVLWTLLGLFVGCWVGNTANNLKHEMMIIGKSNSS